MNGASAARGTLLAGILLLIVYGVHVARFVEYVNDDAYTYYAKAGGFWRSGAWQYVREGAIGPLLGVGGAALAVLGWLAPGGPAASWRRWR